MVGPMGIRLAGGLKIQVKRTGSPGLVIQTASLMGCIGPAASRICARFP